MNTKEMEKLTEHYNRYFGQNESMVLHAEEMEPHIDALLYPPEGKYPFWKLVSMGASDHKMNAPKGTPGDRNEYMMFIAADEDMNDEQIAGYYFNRLMQVAMFPMESDCFITFGHSIEWKPLEDEEMVGAFLELPQLMEDVGILHCKLGLTKTAVCLQVIMLNRAEMDKLMTIGPQSFDAWLYPDGNAPCHFLCERIRSVKF